MKRTALIKGIIIFISITFLTGFGTWLLLEDKKADIDSKLIASSNDSSPASLKPTPTENTKVYNIEESDKLDLNTATKEELDSLEGIGPALAERIINFRNKQPFKTIYDIKKVSGIGEKRFAAIKDKITVTK